MFREPLDSKAFGLLEAFAADAVVAGHSTRSFLSVSVS